MSKRLLTLALVALTGCGFGLVKNSRHCGHHSSGADIWVDDVDDWQGNGVEPDGGPLTQVLADGGVEIWAPGSMHVYLSCEQAMAEMDQAIDFGVRHRFWRASEVGGFVGNLRIEFIDQTTLAGAGFPNADGVTEDYLLVHDMAVDTGRDDYSYFDPELAPSFPWSSYEPSTVILIHELTHAYQCGGFLSVDCLSSQTGKHCNWSLYYAPSYNDLGLNQQWSQFKDDCANTICVGSDCSCQPNVSCSYVAPPGTENTTPPP